MEKKSQKINTALYVVLSIITCGLFYLYWIYKQMQMIRLFDKNSNYSFLVFILLTIITCGLYTIYYYYKVSNSIIKIQKEKNIDSDPNLTILSILLSLFGLGIIVTCIHQEKLNKIALGEPLS